MGSPAETKACIACGSAQSSLVLQKDGFDIVRCGGCGLAHAEPLLSPEGIVSLYRGNRDLGKPHVRRSFLCLARRIARRTGGGKLLDVGCGPGDFIIAARGVKGLEAQGMDRNPDVVAWAVSRGLPVVEGGVEEPPFPAGTFDIVLLQQVMEHLRDPVAALRGVRNLLKPGGWMVAVTPGYEHLRARLAGRRWHYYVPPVHLYYYSKRSIKLLCSQVGLKVTHTSLWHWHMHLSVFAVRE